MLYTSEQYNEALEVWQQKTLNMKNYTDAKLLKQVKIKMKHSQMIFSSGKYVQWFGATLP